MRNKLNMFKKILKIIGVITGLLVLGFIVLMFTVDDPPLQTLVQTEFELIKAGKNAEAYEALSEKFKKKR